MWVFKGAYMVLWLWDGAWQGHMATHKPHIWPSISFINSGCYPEQHLLCCVRRGSSSHSKMPLLVDSSGYVLWPSGTAFRPSGYAFRPSISMPFSLPPCEAAAPLRLRSPASARRLGGVAVFGAALNFFRATITLRFSFSNCASLLPLASTPPPRFSCLPPALPPPLLRAPSTSPAPSSPQSAFHPLCANMPRLRHRMRCRHDSSRGRASRLPPSSLSSSSSSSLENSWGRYPETRSGRGRLFSLSRFLHSTPCLWAFTASFASHGPLSLSANPHHCPIPLSVHLRPPWCRSHHLGLLPWGTRRGSQP